LTTVAEVAIYVKCWQTDGWTLHHDISSSGPIGPDQLHMAAVTMTEKKRPQPINARAVYLGLRHLGHLLWTLW